MILIIIKGIQCFRIFLCIILLIGIHLSVRPLLVEIFLAYWINSDIFYNWCRKLILLLLLSVCCLELFILLIIVLSNSFGYDLCNVIDSFLLSDLFFPFNHLFIDNKLSIVLFWFLFLLSLFVKIANKNFISV